MVLYVESEEDSVSVLNNIILSLKAHKSFFLDRRKGTAVQKFLLDYDLSSYEASLKIRVDLSCCLRRLCPLLYGPSPGLLLPCSQEGHKTKKVVAGLYELVKAGLLKAEALQILSLLLVVKRGYVVLCRCGYDEYSVSGFLGLLPDLCVALI